ncbi:MAG TPA: hypothetical protein VMJ75_15970 [Candidatus Acidoferrales bacterium]|nr:hypothetical protein [Candidatus Acidoferrales bacterium]
MRILFALLMAAAALSAGTLDNNTVTVTATRTMSIQPDQVLLYVNVLTAQDVGLNDVVAKLNGTGITAGNLSNVGTSSAGPLWTFLLPVPFAQMKSVVAALTQAQASLGVIAGSPALTFSVAGTQVSADAQAAQPCPLPALVSDARRQADSMTAAAGLRTGAIVAISDGTPADGTGAIGVPTAAARIGDFSQTLAGFLTAVIATSPLPSCSLTVQFQLIQ